MPFPCRGRGRGRGRGRRSIPILLPSRQQVRPAVVVRVRFPYLPHLRAYVADPRQGHLRALSSRSIVESAPPPPPPRSLLAAIAVVAVVLAAARATLGSGASVVAVAVASAIADPPPEEGTWCCSSRIENRRGGVAGEGGGGGGGGGGGDSPPRCTRCRCTDSIRTQIETRDRGRRSSTGIGNHHNLLPRPPRLTPIPPPIDRRADLPAPRSPLPGFYSDTEAPSYLPTFSS